jgi:hypothetical protein
LSARFDSNWLRLFLQLGTQANPRSAILGCMHLTETFASTVALTIPILALAGAVELRNLSTVVNIRTLTAARKSMADLLELYVMDYEKNRARPNVLKQIIWAIRTAPIDGLGYALPLIWSIVLLYSTIIEIICLVYLAGQPVVPSSGPPIFCIVSIAILMVLLIITPIAQTLIIAPQTAIDQTIRMLNADIGRRVLRELGDSKLFYELPEEEKKRRIERAKSIFMNESLAADAIRKRDTGYRVHAGKQRTPTPRWLIRNRQKPKSSKYLSLTQHRYFDPE